MDAMVAIRRKLLEARRSRQEFQEAKQQYDRIREQFQTTLREWDARQWTQQSRYNARLDKGLKRVAESADKAISEALQRDKWTHGQVDDSSGAAVMIPDTFIQEKQV